MTRETVGRPKITNKWKPISLPEQVYERLDERRGEDQPFWKVVLELLEGEKGRGSPHKLPPEGGLSESDSTLDDLPLEKEGDLSETTK